MERKELIKELNVIRKLARNNGKGLDRKVMNLANEFKCRRVNSVVKHHLQEIEFCSLFLISVLKKRDKESLPKKDPRRNFYIGRMMWVLGLGARLWNSKSGK